MDDKKKNEFAQVWIKSWNSRDLDDILSHYAEDVEITTPTVELDSKTDTITLKGKKAVANHWKSILTKFPDLKFKLFYNSVSVNSIALYYKSVLGEKIIEVMFFDRSGKVKKMVANYFKNPIGMSNKSSTSLLKEGSASVLDLGHSTAIQQHEKEMELFKQMGEKILNELAKEPTFKNLLSQIKIQIVKEGLKIEIMESSKDMFFEIGTSKLTKEAKLLLEKIGDELAKIQNKIIIEGHTDARPYANGGTGYTNFELSADRANSARRALVSDSLTPSHIFEVRGYADRELRDKADPFNFVNRRISIIVKYSDYKE